MKPTRRRRTLLVVVAGLLLAGATALFLVDDGKNGKNDGKDGSDVPELTDEQALIFGRITDAKTKKPLAGAKVVIQQGPGSLTAVADRQGRYRIVVSVKEPLSFVTEAEGYMGTAAGAVGQLCPRERFELNLAPLPAGTREAPPAPLFLSGNCPVP